MERQQKIKKAGLQYSFLILLCIISILGAVSVGTVDLSPIDSLKILLSKVPFLKSLVKLEEIKEIYNTIVWEVRLPRVLLSGLTGGGLALVGAVFQGLFRNPLADPHILGVSSGAAIGATIAILSGIQVSFLGLGAIGCLAFLGALITVALVYRFACMGNRVPVVNLLLIGTAISTMLSAIISLLMAMNRNGIEKVYLWTLGSFSAANWQKNGYLSCFLILCGIILIFYAKELNLLVTGEETAQSLGMNPSKVKKKLIVTASLLVAACVSVSGMIGFVGLIIPHCMRIMSGSDHRKLLPYSLFGGAVFMIICDTIARTITAPSELPVGVITSILGAPYFIYLIARNQKKKIF